MGIYSVKGPGLRPTAREIQAAYVIAEQVAAYCYSRGQNQSEILHSVFTELWRWARAYERSGGTIELPLKLREDLTEKLNA